MLLEKSLYLSFGLKGEGEIYLRKSFTQVGSRDFCPVA